MKTLFHEPDVPADRAEGTQGLVREIWDLCDCMSDHLLQKIAHMSLEEIDKVANATPITFFSMRLDEDSMKQVLDSPANAVGALSVSALALSGR